MKAQFDFKAIDDFIGRKVTDLLEPLQAEMTKDNWRDGVKYIVWQAVAERAAVYAARSKKKTLWASEKE